MMEDRKEWHEPVLVTYGDVRELTMQTKLKQPGIGDDFQVAGISSA